MLEPLHAVAHKSDRRGIGELKTHFPPQNGIEAAGLRKIALALHRAGAGAIGAVAPLRDVQVVNAPAGNHSQRELSHILVVIALELFFVEAGLRRGPDPPIPVQVIRRWLLGEDRALPAARRRDLNFPQLAETAIQGQLAGPAELRIRPLLRAKLKHHALLANSHTHASGLFERERHWLLVVNMFAVQNGIQRRHAVPMHRQGHQHRIERRERVQLAKIRKDPHVRAAVTLADQPARAFDVPFIHIADGCHAHVFVAQEFAQVGLPLRPHANDSERDFARWRLGAEHSGRHEPRRSARSKYALEKGAPRCLSCRYFHYFLRIAPAGVRSKDKFRRGLTFYPGATGESRPNLEACRTPDTPRRSPHARLRG